MGIMKYEKKLISKGYILYIAFIKQSQNDKTIEMANRLLCDQRLGMRGWEAGRGKNVTIN